MSENEYIKRHKAWMGRYYGQLEGATITQFMIGIEPDFGDMFPMFKVRLKDGKQIEIAIYQDDEGNGPGFIHGLDHAQAVATQQQPQTPSESDRDKQLETAESLLKDHGGAMWHSGGGIMLIARFIGETRITASPDETDAGTFGIEVTDEESEVLFFKDGLDAEQLVTEWVAQVTKHST